jgi:transcriptional regulator with XRE-family HTH domain
VSQSYDARSQQAFAAAVCRVMRESRRRQKLTQAEVAQRTGGLVSKAALANYETGHRSLRVDVLWVIAGALGEDLGELLTAAERGVTTRPVTGVTGAITVDVGEVMATADPRLAPVKRWIELRTNGGAAAAVTLDDGAIAALAALMNVSALETRRLLISTIRSARHTGAPAPAPLPR